METNLNFKVFDLYDISGIEVKDPGLKAVINLQPRLILKSHGRNVHSRFWQTKVNIIERLMNRLGVAGHRGKKHKIIGHSTGKYSKNMRIVLEALDRVQKKTGKNPVEVLVKAIENSAPRDETTVIEYGGARYPQAVDVSPLRRINLAIRWLVHGASDKAFNKKKTIGEALGEEIILASENSGDSMAVRKRNEAEKQADSAR